MTSVLTDDQLALLPTDDEVVAYRERGFHVSGRILPDAVLDAALEGMERFYAGDLDAPFPGRTRFDDFDWNLEHGDVLRKNDYASRMVRQLADLVAFPLIAAVAARLSGVTEIRLWHDQLLFKPPEATPRSGNVGWHTDRQYWQTCSSQEMLTAWAPFTPVDATMGPLTFVEGSHRWDQQRLDFWNPDLVAGEQNFARDDAVKVAVPLERGQVTFHHCRTVHGSGPNRAKVPRRSMAIHLQPADNHFVSATEADGTPAYHRNDDLVRRVDGVPDYADPRISPRLYP